MRKNVTRTFFMTTGTATTVNPTTKEMTSEPFEVAGDLTEDTKRLAKAVKNFFSDKVLITIDNVEKQEELRAMSVEDFIKYSHVATKQEKEEAEE